MTPNAFNGTSISCTADGAGRSDLGHSYGFKNGAEDAIPVLSRASGVRSAYAQRLVPGPWKLELWC